MKGKGQVDTYTLMNSAMRPRKNRQGKLLNAGVQLRKSRFMADSQIDHLRSNDPTLINRHSSIKSSDLRSPDRRLDRSPEGSVGGELPIEIKLSKGDLSSSSDSGSPRSPLDAEQPQDRKAREIKFGLDSPKIINPNHPSKKYYDETPMICEDTGRPKFVSFKSSLNNFFSRANSLKTIKIKNLRNILPFGPKNPSSEDEDSAPADASKKNPSLENLDLEGIAGVKNFASQQRISSSSLNNKNRTFKQLQLNLVSEAHSPRNLTPKELGRDTMMPLTSERNALLAPEDPPQQLLLRAKTHSSELPQPQPEPEPQEIPERIDLPKKKRVELVEPTVPKPQESPRRQVRNLELPTSKKLGSFGLKLEEMEAEPEEVGSPQQRSHLELEVEHLEPSKQQRRSPRGNSRVSTFKRRNGLDLNLIPTQQMRKIKSLKEEPKLSSKKSMVDLNYQYEDRSSESSVDSEEEDHYKADIEAKTGELQANPRVLEYFHKKNTIRYSANANLGLFLLAADLLVAQLHLLSNSELDASPRLLGTTFIVVAMLYLILTQASLRSVQAFKAAVVSCILARLALDLLALHSIKREAGSRPL